MSQPQVFIVTGSSKGLGYGIVNTLLKIAPESSTIYLTSRNEEAGLKALSQFKNENLKSKIVYHQLDITDLSSIDTLVDKIKSTHGYLDVLINNAGLALANSEAPKIVKTNYYGTLNTCMKFIPVMRPGTGRIVSISSIACNLNGFHSEELRREISDQNITLEKLSAFVGRYEKDFNDGTAKEKGWPVAYSVAKAGVVVLTSILAKEHPGILVNCCCPGRVATDMGIRFGPESPIKTLEEGVRIPCRLAVGNINGISGKFWRNSNLVTNGDGNPTDWSDEAKWDTVDIDFLKAYVW